MAGVTAAVCMGSATGVSVAIQTERLLLESLQSGDDGVNEAAGQLQLEVRQVLRDKSIDGDTGRVLREFEEAYAKHGALLEEALRRMEEGAKPQLPGPPV